MIELKYGTRRVISFRGARKVVGGLTDQNKISVLLYISKELANVGKEDELFDRVMALCKEIFECDNTTVRLWDGKNLIPVKYIKETQPPRRELQANEGYSGKTFFNKKPMLFKDLREFPEYIDLGETTRCVISAPIIYKEENMGTIAVESDKEFFYKEDDLEILEALSSQLGLALTGVRLIEGILGAKAREAAILSQLEWDLKMGRNVQAQILQNEPAPWNGIYLSTHYEPMVEVSGDYFDIIKQGNTMTIIIVDVSGHGIPAALVTMSIHFQFHRCVTLGLGLTEIMEEMARLLKPQLPESTYFTAFLIRFYSDYTYSYVNGGHQKALHIKNNDEIIELDGPGLPLGILDVKKSDYEEMFGKIDPGDHMILFTDGFTEQKNSHHEEYGHGRFIESFLNARKKLSDVKQNFFVRDAVKEIVSSWKEFKSTEQNNDDLSLVLLQCNPLIDEAIPMYRAAKNAARESNFQDAYKLALKAYSIEPSYKDNLLFLGKMHYNDHNYKESIHFIEEYIKTSGEDTALIHYLHGKALFNNDSISGSKLALKKSLSCDHTFAKSTLLLAKCYLREGAIPKAIKTLQRGIKSSPTNEQIKLSLQKLETIQSGQKI